MLSTLNSDISNAQYGTHSNTEPVSINGKGPKVE
jgi:hypothetical protein